MDFNEFKETIIKYLMEDYGEENITCKEYRKNNSSIRTGISIRKDKINICPTVYLENYYEELDKGRDIEEIASMIAHTLKQAEFTKDFDVEYITDYENIKDKVFIKVINTEKNEELLEGVPHFNYLDVSIVFYVGVKLKKKEKGSILITNSLFDMFDVKLDTLYADAKKNNRYVNNLYLKPIEEVLKELFKETGNTKGLNEEEFMNELPLDEMSNSLFVLSNESRTFGAAYLCDQETLSYFASTINEGFYIIPSSIHELILIPESKVDDSGYLIEMVRTINEQEVPIEDVLSDNVYYFNKCENSVTLITE